MGVCTLPRRRLAFLAQRFINTGVLLLIPLTRGEHMTKIVKDEHGERLEAGPSYDSENGKELREKVLRE